MITGGNGPRACSQCGNEGSDEGFIEDMGEQSHGYARWGIFGGAKRWGRNRRAITALRCPRCGHLELFAGDPV